MNDELVGFDDISPTWLAGELDTHGVVRLRGVFSSEWLEDMRSSVAAYLAENGNGDVFVPEADHEIGSPAHRLASNPAVGRLFREAVRLRRPKLASGDDAIRCSMLVRAGAGAKARSNLFHYDSHTLTMIVPVFIPRAELGSCGELAAFGNKRPFRRFVATHLIEAVLTHNAFYRRRVARAVLDAPEKHIVDLEPGDAYLFWGYRTFHGNLDCAPGLLRTTLVLHYGEVHRGSRILRAAWRFSRSRRDLGRLQHLPATPARPEVAA